MALHRRDPGKYILNLKLTKYSQWKLSGSGWIVCDLEPLKLTVITAQFGLICRQANWSEAQSQLELSLAQFSSSLILSYYHYHHYYYS